jgi:hypothetical protein
MNSLGVVLVGLFLVSGITTDSLAATRPIAQVPAQQLMGHGGAPIGTSSSLSPEAQCCIKLCACMHAYAGTALCEHCAAQAVYAYCPQYTAAAMHSLMLTRTANQLMGCYFLCEMCQDLLKAQERERRAEPTGRAKEQ